MTSWRYLGDCVCSLLTYIHTKQTQGSVFVHQMFPCVHQLVVCWYKAVSIRFIRALWSERWKKKTRYLSSQAEWPCWAFESPCHLSTLLFQPINSCSALGKTMPFTAVVGRAKKTRLMMFLRTCQRKYGEHSNQCEWDECSNIETT